MTTLQQGSRTLAELAEAVGGQVHGDPQRRISGVNGLAEARSGEIAFYNNARYREQLTATQASAILLKEAADELLGGRDAIVVGDPYLAFAQISTLFHPRPSFAPGIDPRAVVEEGAEVDPSATVMAFAFVARGAKVGARAVLFPNVFIGEGSTVGADSLLYPGVVVREGCSVGERAILQPGVVLGGDGFGFAFDAANLRHFKIPQAGTVVVESDVEVGSNSAIDRATLGTTRIGQGTKIDNLVQVGHNVQVGPLCILCGHVGIAGSSTLGTGVVLGGQVGLANHLKLGDGVRIGAQSGVLGDLEEGEYLGTPPMKGKQWLRAQAAFQRGPETLKTVARLERRIEELEAKLEAVLNSK